MEMCCKNCNDDLLTSEVDLLLFANCLHKLQTFDYNLENEILCECTNYEHRCAVEAIHAQREFKCVSH